ncbi:MFS transporter [Herbidospora sp. NEAU-GS84]|uniref:MFS transporter n=1 Tax=Herbidospora solisilvae TaxID=2696284 RepID=A0A7C9NDI2_9ACTN|nr:MFS transporter [Herbidospora solisilvae]NAS21895.1 MFS transporter [Herbidospora solisilvae]
MSLVETRSRPLLGLILTGQFMAILDVSIVNVAAPTIQADLAASGAELQLIVAGYTIAYAMLLITGARLGGRSGYRRWFLAGLAVFTVASLLCGIAPGAATLIAFRLLQGAGAALMVPQVLSLIQVGVPQAGRARALGVYAAVISLAAVGGQILGGLLVTLDLFGTSWRPIFLVNVPIGLALLWLGARNLPADEPQPGRGLDLPGLLTLSLATSLVVVPLVLERGWAVMIAGLLVFAGFVVIQRRVAHPLIPGRLLRVPGLVAAGVAIFGVMAVYGGFLFSNALHLQHDLHDSPLRAGLTFVPMAGAFGLVSINWKRIPARLHRRLIVSASVVVGLGLVALAGVFSGGGHGLPYLLIVLAVIGAGMAGAFSPLMTVALARVAPADAPDASGLLAMMLQLGQVVGVAAFGTLFLSTGSISVTMVCLAATAFASAVAARWLQD